MSGWRGHVELLVLAVLEDGGPLHGYAILEAIRQSSQGEFDLAESTIYPALHQLEERKWIRGRWAEVDGRRRRTYQLTAAGKRGLQERRQSWVEFAAGIGRVLGDGA